MYIHLDESEIAFLLEQRHTIVSLKDLVDRIRLVKSEEDIDKEYRELAGNEYDNDGEVEVDGNGIVSKSDDGAYVMAWVWVSRPEKWDDEGEDESGEA